MKGMFVQQQVEFRLEVKGDGFHQGQTIPCSMAVKNHGSGSLNLASVTLALAIGTAKKIKERSDEAFETIASAVLPAPGEIKTGEQKSFTWNFELDQNCVISEKSQSLYLVFGSDAIPGAKNQLLLTVATHPHIKALYQILETSFQFVFKQEKSAGGFVVAKFKPPSAPKFSVLEELNLHTRFEGDDLQLKYAFSVKKFEASSANSIGVKKVKSDFTQRIEASRYLLSGNFINHPVIEAAIEEALSKV